MIGLKLDLQNIIEYGNLDGYKLLKQDDDFVFYEITK